MVYTGKTNWQINDIVMPGDMNRIEQGIIDAHENLLTHNADDGAHQPAFDAHNADTNSHTDIRNKIDTDISSHNTSTSAHTDIRNKIQTVQQNASLFMLPVKRNTTYAVGDCASATGLPSWAYLECVTAGTTDESEPDFSGVTSGDKVTYGTAVFIIRKIGSLSGFEIGDIKWSSADLTQAGFLIANGAEVGRATYPDLCAVYEAMGFPWGAGDGSTTFNLPNLIGKFPEGASSAGGYHEAGLPNIEASFGKGYGFVVNQLTTMSGALYHTGVTPVNGTTTESSYASLSTVVDFDASRSNPIYGSSNTVQPPSALLIPYVKAFNGASADSTDLAITEVANDVVRISGRVYLVESAVNDDGSWYRKYSDGWLEQGGVTAKPTSSETLVTFLKPFNSIKNVTATQDVSSYMNGSYSNGCTEVGKVGNTTMTIVWDNVEGGASINYVDKFYWYACGMGAS